MKVYYKAILLKTFFLGLLLPFPSYIFSATNSRGLKKQLIRILKKPEIKAFLDMIAAAEGTDFRLSFYERFPIIGGSGGYKVRFPNTTFDSYESHPSEVICATLGGKEWCSSAAGRYQFLKRTWDKVAKELELKDFSPRNQDLAALYLIWERGVIKYINNGKVKTAVKILNTIWASFPGSPYGQPVHSMDKVVQFFEQRVVYHKNLNRNRA